jgi:hypothetical protein
LRRHDAFVRFAREMKGKLAIAILLLAPAAADARSRPPLYDPVLLNIGLVCRWDNRCMERQKNAMKRATKFVARTRPPLWRVQQCNRNAARGRLRVDWIGYDNCIRNAALRPAPTRRIQKRRVRPIT